MKLVLLPLAIVMALMISESPSAIAQAAENNFPDRKAIIIDNSPFIKLSGFKFENVYADRRFRLDTDLSWQNISAKVITAFEVVIAYYDPFNRPIRAGGVWLIPGHDSANWTPLGPSEKASDGVRAYNTEYAYTAFAFVRAVRLTDGTVWQFDEKEVESAIKKHLPTIKDFSNINPKEKTAE